MNKFMKDIEKDIKKHAKKELSNSTLEIECPKCKKVLNVSFRNNRGRCPSCNELINLKQNWG